MMRIRLLRSSGSPVRISPSTLEFSVSRLLSIWAWIAVLDTGSIETHHVIGVARTLLSLQYFHAWGSEPFSYIILKVAT